MPVFRFDKGFGIARRAKTLLRRAKTLLKDSREALASRESLRNIRAARREEQTRNRERARRLRSEHRKKIKSEIKSRKRELKRIRQEGFDAGKKGAAGVDPKRRKKTVQQEILRLERELRAVKERAAGEPKTSALPDFVVIGGKKCGTSFLYHLLSQHPLVEPASAKELHFFDRHFDEGVEWYRRCFPQPKIKDGRMTITGEGTPYMHSRLVPERMVEVIPRARLIVLLRNPVDRAYSDYQQVVSKGRETRTFEEAVCLEGTMRTQEARSFGKEETTPEGGDSAGLDDNSEYLSRGVYLDQLLRWLRFFNKEQMLVLKSEDFFEGPAETLRVAYGFLGLPEWEPEASEIKPKKLNKGDYEGEMDPTTRRRLEEYFGPHNRRLYDLLGKDLGW